MTDKKYILSIDSGSTGIRAILFNKEGEIVCKEYEETPGIYPEPGAIEHDPKVLWEALLSVGRKVFSQEEFSPEDVAAIGICNQRASFMLWDRKTGEPLSNFINWADVRAVNKCEEINHSPKWKTLKFIGKLVGKITGISKMVIAGMFNFPTDDPLVRLLWFFDLHPDLYERANLGEIMYGTLETWFIYNLTNKKRHVSDYTNASSTSMYDREKLEQDPLTCGIFKIPKSMFPEAIDNNGDFGMCEKEHFGAEIPIRGAIGDQMAAMFGHCCFEIGDVKISQGSGGFVDVNVGTESKFSKRGLYPLIAWVLDGKPVYLLEGILGTAGTLIDWLGKGIGLADTPQALNEFAAQTEDTEGVIFIPTNAGIRFPYFNANMRGTILGLSLATHRRHVARAVFEGLALRLYDIIEGIEKDTKTKIKSIKVDGGVSKSDILLQIIADFANLEVKRAPEPDMTATGAAYIAGLACGFWKDIEEIKSISDKSGYTSFKPKMDAKTREKKIARWKRAVKAVNTID
ncbi:MAG: glycerol kinase [archaeon]|nr:glycerol kinase [archaeon]